MVPDDDEVIEVAPAPEAKAVAEVSPQVVPPPLAAVPAPAAVAVKTDAGIIPPDAKMVVQLKARAQALRSLVNTSFLKPRPFLSFNIFKCTFFLKKRKKQSTSNGIHSRQALAKRAAEKATATAPGGGKHSLLAGPKWRFYYL